MYEVDEWTIEKENDLWLVYPTESGSKSFDFQYFATEKEAIEFAENYAPIEEND